MTTIEEKTRRTAIQLCADRLKTPADTLKKIHVKAQKETIVLPGALCSNGVAGLAMDGAIEYNIDETPTRA